MRRHPVPLYVQIERALRVRIRSGELMPGDSLGSEADLCKQFNVSKIVVRQALQNLEHDGLIIRVQGKGTYVAEHANTRTLRFYSPWFDDLIQENVDYRYQLLRKAEILPPPHVARVFNGSTDHRLCRFEGVRTLHEEPVLYVIVYLPLEIGTQVADHIGPNVTYIGLIEQRLGIRVIELQQEISACRADEPVASVLGLEVGAPTLWMRRIYASREGPVALSENFARPDKYRYSVRITR